jgi:hemerythrin-like domain-containing protein
VQLEKEVFYPAIVSKLGDAIPETILEDQQTEEQDGTQYLEDLDGDTLEGEEWMDTFREFKDIALTHAVEVEEGELFPLVEQKMSKRDLDELGTRMEKRHRELHQRIEAQAR